MGYWEPHSASIDFCESNYLHSQYVVEFHNTWSSLAGLSSLGVLGLFHGNPTRELRYALAYQVLIAIGLGSTGLHGSLHWFFQSSDELPMIWLVMSLFYLLAEFDAPLQGPPNYPRLPVVLSYITVLLTAIYYAFQKIYLVFIMSFILETLIVVVWFARVLFATTYGGKLNDKRKFTTKWLGIMAFASLTLIAFPLWLYDMFQCNTFLPIVDHMYFFRGITPHVLWHFFSGLGAYCAIICLSCCRLEELQIPYELRFRLGFLPTLQRIMKREKSSFIQTIESIPRDEESMCLMERVNNILSK